MRACRLFGVRLGTVLACALAVLAVAKAGTMDAQAGPSTGCLRIVAGDSATGAPLDHVIVTVLGTKLGTMTDSLGRGIVCGLPLGRAVLRITGEDRAPRIDTTWVARGRINTVLVALAARPPGFVDLTVVRFGPPKRIDTRSNTPRKH